MHRDKLVCFLMQLPVLSLLLNVLSFHVLYKCVAFPADLSLHTRSINFRSVGGWASLTAEKWGRKWRLFSFARSPHPRFWCCGTVLENVVDSWWYLLSLALWLRFCKNSKGAWKCYFLIGKDRVLYFQETRLIHAVPVFYIFTNYLCLFDLCKFVIWVYIFNSYCSWEIVDFSL